MNESDSLDTDGFLIRAIRHEGVLRALSDGPAGRSEVEEVAEVSTSTAYRVLSSFVEHGLVEKDSGVYRLTPVGDAVLGEIRGFRETVGRVGRTRPIADAVPDEVGFEPSLFDDGTVTVSDTESPYDPERRFVGLMRDADAVRFLGVSSVVPVALTESGRIASEGGLLEVVCPEEVAAANDDRLPTDEDVRDSVSVLVHGDLPATVALVDERVCVGAHDHDRGMLTSLADTDDAEAYEWGERVYERYRMESEEYL